ncbi:hypothetical protein PPL_06522 [Heterostelium album PN500]|uniref:Uncharacterized protein n=1 Tax=Heterostelium pallidum (strain ATCC 26659 / Pp 5 / PN500) TaxID=670386 RepID=D3BDD9_HETP5|nr:hypothetical protein PPL_06522 [Heterostelium album PN500]EFA80583.1 hypothetical protein PPL_06522 [Heterostelium album PN500]|eukprot:XP_020432703.1 hypothetical protein PPL_06522 [Heterostelium album PN500]
MNESLHLSRVKLNVLVIEKLDGLVELFISKSKESATGESSCYWYNSTGVPNLMNDPSITNAVATTTTTTAATTTASVTTTAAATTTATTTATTATTRVSTFANQPLINENLLPIPAFSVGESVYGKAVNGRDFGTWRPATVKSIKYSNENNEWCYTIKFKQGNEGLETLIGHNLVTIDEDKEFTVNNIKDRLDVLVFDKTTKKYYKGEIIEGTEQSNTRKRKVTAIEVACEGTNNYDLNNILNSTGIQISKERKRNEIELYLNVRTNSYLDR